MNTRKTGDELERDLIRLLDNCGIPNRQTTNSGAYAKDSDVMTHNELFECKRQLERAGTPIANAKIVREEWLKHKSQAENLGRIPIMIIENGFGEKFAVLNLDQFVFNYLHKDTN